MQQKMCDKIYCFTTPRKRFHNSRTECEEVHIFLQTIMSNTEISLRRVVNQQQVELSDMYPVD